MPKRKKQKRRDKSEDIDNNNQKSPGKIFDRGTYKEFKYCAKCKKIMVWRKKWSNNWDTVKYCSKKCKNQSKQSTSS